MTSKLMGGGQMGGGVGEGTVTYDKYGINFAECCSDKFPNALLKINFNSHLYICFY
jgi:hypothetical protein